MCPLPLIRASIVESPGSRLPNEAFGGLFQWVFAYPLLLARDVSSDRQGEDMQWRLGHMLGSKTSRPCPSAFRPQAAGATSPAPARHGNVRNG